MSGDIEIRPAADFAPAADMDRFVTLVPGRLIVALPPRPDAAIFTVPAFEDWWAAGLQAAILSRDLSRDDKITSVKLLMALALANGLE